MKRIYLFIVFIIAIKITSSACDVCGCRLGGLSYGILPQHFQHLVGVKYSYARFHAKMNHDSEYLGDEYSDDTYQRIDVVGRISLLPRLQLNVQLPYLINAMDGSHQKVSSSGIGDPVAMLYFSAFNTGTNESNWKNSLLVGAGVKLPFGEYRKEDDGLIINRNFQMGSGSVDYLVSANYTVSLNDWGLNTEASYKMNGTNDQDYRFGNQFNASGYFFRYLETSTIGFLPYAGAYYEFSEHHFEGKVEQVNTGGTALFATVGTQVYWNQLSLNLEYQAPIHQSYNSDEVATIETRGRFAVGLIWSIVVNQEE